MSDLLANGVSLHVCRSHTHGPQVTSHTTPNQDLHCQKSHTTQNEHFPYQRHQKTHTRFLKLRNKKTQATFVSPHLDSILSCFTCRTHQPCKFHYNSNHIKGTVKFIVTEGRNYPRSSSKREYAKAGRN